MLEYNLPRAAKYILPTLLTEAGVLCYLISKLLGMVTAFLWNYSRIANLDTECKEITYAALVLLKLAFGSAKIARLVGR